MPLPQMDWAVALGNRLIAEQHSYGIEEQKQLAAEHIPTFNQDQLSVFNAIVNTVETKSGQCFFLHGSGGTGYTPVAPVNVQGEYNIPPEDNENGDDEGAPFGPAPPGRHVPYQAPPPQPPPKNQGKGQNPNPPVPLEPTPPGSTPSESESDDFYAPKTPSPRSPSSDAPDSLHRFFNPNLDPCHFDLYDQKQIFYKNQANPSTPSQIRYNYTRHGRQLSWDWHNPTTEAQYNPEHSIPEWYHPGGYADLDNTVFEEFLQQQGPCQTSPTPAAPRQPPNPVGNPPRHSGRQRQPIHQPDNIYRDEAPIDIL